MSGLNKLATKQEIIDALQSFYLLFDEIYWLEAQESQTLAERIKQHGIEQEPLTNNELIDTLADRFLGWKLPEDFNPDCGISFKKQHDFVHPKFGVQKYEPIGTNLFSLEQAKELMKYLLDGIAGVPKTESQEAVLTNPYTGTPCDYRDVNVDPEGLLIVESSEQLPSTEPAISILEMTDKQLLELAAKAAGYTHVTFGRDGKAWWHVNPDLTRPWNPLTDDGDALRLAVKLNIDITESQAELFNEIGHSAYNLDSYAATRRTIVKAAAEIGDGKKARIKVLHEHNDEPTDANCLTDETGKCISDKECMHSISPQTFDEIADAYRMGYDWQPIETAPLRELIILCDKTKKVQQGYIYEVTNVNLTPTTTLGERVGAFCIANSWNETHCKPIAWMPLPEAMKCNIGLPNTVVMVYKHKETGKIDTSNLANAHLFESNPNEWELIASLNAIEWIRCNYEKVEQHSKDISELITENEALRMHIHRFLFVAKHADKAIQLVSESN